MLHPLIEKAYQALDGDGIGEDLALELAGLDHSYLLDLVSLANKVKNKFSPGYHVCTITNAKSGLCAENCSYCSQSAHNRAEIETYPLVTRAEIIRQAECAYAAGVRHFGIVTSGKGYLKVDGEFNEILAAMDGVRARFRDMELGASLGVLSEETAAALAARGLWDYNHNLQVNPEKYSALIADTHTVDERIRTIRLLKKHSIRVCSGGILGLGETMQDRVRLAFTLKDLDVDIVPLNVLIPIPGTRVEGVKPLSMNEVALTFCLFRLILPRKTVKFAAGRETLCRDFQGLLMLCGMNGFLTGGYLTTRGRDTAEDMQFLEQLRGF